MEASGFKRRAKALGRFSDLHALEQGAEFTLLQLSGAVWRQMAKAPIKDFASVATSERNWQLARGFTNHLAVPPCPLYTGRPLNFPHRWERHGPNG
jgi:hypothetical protein